MVVIETEGDAFHRTREQRRLDRRRMAAYAATPYAVVPVDWRDWYRDREHVLASIDAAIARQRQLGIGADIEPPRR
jgi:very-short-patch-repair endonuclease